MYIVEFKNGDEYFWLTDGNGDPARTLTKENAKRFTHEFMAINALDYAINNFPARKLKGKGKVVPIELSEDEKIIFKYISENITESTKKNLLSAINDARIQTRAEGWIKVDENNLPDLNIEVLVITNYSKYDGAKRVQMGVLRHSSDVVYFGGVNALIGSGSITGHYWSLPSIIPFEIVTHYRLKPEFPNE